MKNAPLRHGLELILYTAVTRFLLALPHTAVVRFGRALGALGHAFDVRHRRLVLRNLELALPGLGSDERKRVARACYRHFGRAFCEVYSVSRFDESEMRARFRVEGRENLEAARAKDRGLLVLTGHFGSWQVAIYPISLLVGGLHAVARPPDNPHLARHLLGLRERCGVKVVDTAGVSHRLVNLLRRKAAVGLVVDHRPPPDTGIVIPFLGRPARTSSVPAIAAAYCGSPAVPTSCAPDGQGGYALRFGAPIDPAGRDPAEIERLTRRYQRSIEEEIERQPELWFWMHDRWKS